MIRDSFETRNFLFFLNEVHPLSIEDSVIGALAMPSSWQEIVQTIREARQKDAFVRSIKKLQLYIHVPFCGRLCTFCHCARVLLRRRTEIDAYINVLKAQMMLLSPAYKGMEAGAVCFGGGTPSILNEQQLADVIDGINLAFGVNGRKILFEAHPASWTASKLSVLSDRGLFRLSVGVQSLDEKLLRRVSRFQTRKKVLWCLRSARKAGVPYVNVDFMAGLPGQTQQGLSKDLKEVIDQGANVVHVHPYCSLPLKEMCAPSEKILDFIKRRSALIKAAAHVLQRAGFRRNGLGAYALNQEGEDHQEEAYCRLEAGVAAFGPSAKGQLPGAVFYKAGGSQLPSGFPAVEASVQDRHYAMAHYAVIAVIDGLDEKVFFKRFGASLDHHCREGLRYLQQLGLVAFSKGVWKFSGKWELRRVREHVALSRVLFGEDILSRLRRRFLKHYDPRKDYSRGDSLLKAYTNNWLMSLYYRMGI